jgi:methionyl aminopeptidase
MIILKSEKDIEGIRSASRIVGKALKRVGKSVVPGVSLEEIDRDVEAFIREQGARPAFKGYRGFPASACISLDNEVVHGIPDDRKIEKGTLVKVDIGVEKDGFFGDAARTFIVGEVPDRARELVRVTEKALREGIRHAVSGGRLSDISHAIERTVRAANFSPVKDLGGHGVGLMLHEDPVILNYGAPHRGPELKESMVLAIEPMVNIGVSEIDVLRNGWTVVTADGSLSAHFEDTILVRNGNAEVLTRI